MTRHTKIVATLGPASNSPLILETLIRAGVDVVRLNFSHGKAADHIALATMVREIAAQVGRPVGILADLQGPKIRVGKFVEGKITLDGRVRFTGERAARGLVIVFDFLSPEREVVTSQKTQVADDVVRAGQEASYQTVLVDPVRAVSYQVRAFDAGERDLRVANPGPYPIE